MEHRFLFGAGADLASALWFFSLTYGASRLAPLVRICSRGGSLMPPVAVSWLWLQPRFSPRFPSLSSQKPEISACHLLSLLVSYLHE
ncbi:MAG: hypothetical protein KF893_16865 [Caldilineaceae bacterium]|nr:hypothetical protein [Caldilineaceae bacterium]